MRRRPMIALLLLAWLERCCTRALLSAEGSSPDRLAVELLCSRIRRQAGAAAAGRGSLGFHALPPLPQL